MNNIEVPKISLFNTDESIKETLSKEYSNIKSHKLNGRVFFKDEFIGYRRNHDTKYDIPGDLHESDIIIIDTLPPKDRIYTSKTVRLRFDSLPHDIDIMPVDIKLINDHLNSNQKKRIVIVFCEQFSEEEYKIYFPENKESDHFISHTFYIGENNRPIFREGSRYKTAQSQPDPILDCIIKHADKLTYKVVFDKDFMNPSSRIYLLNESDEVISFSTYSNNSFLIFLPSLADKENFLFELLSRVLPSISEFHELFPNNTSFSWLDEPSYLSAEELNIIHKTKELELNYLKEKESLSTELLSIKDRQENIFLKNLLKETDDQLVYAVEWFLKYIGFENIERPDENIKQGDVFEEDLRINDENETYLIEIKGIGGTSTDAQCSQISKIVNRKRKQNTGRKYIGIYIVNHQRFKAPLSRILPPFNEKQIEDAEIAYRGMTYTFELFNVYHMIEQKILSKEQVRTAFLEDGLLNFRKPLIPLPRPHIFPKPEVYSFDIGENSNLEIKKGDCIVLVDDNSHWHKVAIVELQVDKTSVERANKGKVGIKTSGFFEKAKDYYLLPNQP